MIYQQPFWEEKWTMWAGREKIKNQIRWGEEFQESTRGRKKQIIGSFSAEECLNIVSKVCGASVQMLSQIGAAVVRISEITLGVKGLL